MEVLLYVFVTIHLADRRLGNNMITIVEAIMLHIVTKCGHQQRKSVYVLEVCFLDHALALQNQMAMLSHIRPMKVIMVFNRSFVLIIDLHEELEELVVVHGLQKIVLLKQRCCHKWHLHISSNCLGELKDVEVVRIDSIEEMKIVLN